MARPTVTPTWGGTQTEPSGGLKASGYAAGDRPAAEHVNWLLDNFADWINYLDLEKLSSVTLATSTDPVFGSPSISHDHPSSAANKWKLLLEGRLLSNLYARLYVGDDTGGAGGHFAITVNAKWDAASGAQNWFKDDTTKISTILWAGPTGNLAWFQRAAGAGTWTSSWDAGVGDVSVGGALAIGTDLSVTDDLTVGDDLIVTGAAIAGTVTTTGDVTSGADVVVTGDVVYASPVVVRKQLPLLNGHITGNVISLGSLVTLTPSQSMNISLDFPTGSQLGEVRVLGSGTGGLADVDIYLYRHHSIGMSPSLPAFPTDQLVDSATGVVYSGGAVSNDDCDWGGISVFANERYDITILHTAGSPATNVEIAAIDVEVTYPTNRPY